MSGLPGVVRAKWSTTTGLSGGFLVAAIVGLTVIAGVVSYLGSHQQSPTTELAGNLALFVSALFTAAVCARAAWRRTPAFRGWALLALALLLWSVGQAIYTFYGLTRGNDYPFPSLADAFYLAYGIPALAAVFAFPRFSTASVSRRREVLDAAVIASGVMLVSWMTVLAPFVGTADPGRLVWLVPVAYPVVDVIVCSALFAVGMRQPAGRRLHWLLFGGGLVVLALTDGVYVRLAVDGQTGLTGGPLVAGWLTAFFLVVLATFVPDSDRKAAPDGRLGLPLELIPYAPVLVAVAVGVVKTPDPNIFVRGTGALMLVFLTMRQVTILLDNRSLTRDLEKKVVARTAELNRLGSLVKSSKDAIVGFSLDGSVVSWNPAADSLFGYRGAEFIGGPPSFLSAEYLAGLHEIIKSAELGHSLPDFELELPRTDGSTIPIALTISPIADDEGRIEGISISGHDISERRQAAAVLEAARKDALESSRVKSEFLATMSHEIRTPMNGVIGLTSLLLDTSLDEVQRQYAEGVQGAGEALLTVINDVLDFSKLEAGKVELESADFNVRALVEEVGGLLAPQASPKRLELLIYCLPDVPPTIRGDAGRLRQVLLNLASNAVKFTEFGEVSIKVSCLGFADERVRLRFEVIDTGIGVAEEDRKRLFESFSQADASTTRRYGGTGLGLAICRRLVEAMDGTIGVDSVVGAGSVFWFEVSLSLAPAAAGDDSALPADMLTGLRVLVVDDNATNRMIVGSQLVSWRLEPHLVEDGRSALLQMREMATKGQPYDIAILDMCMPEMNGLQLAQEVSSDSALSQTRMIMLTSIQVDVAALRQAGVGEWLKKPVRGSELYDRLTRLVATEGTKDPAPPSVRADAPPAAGSLGRVLIVEDNALNQLVAEGVVSRIGYQVDIVANGAEALAALASISYAAVLMDCHMPVMDGFEATKELRRRQGDGHRTPIIAMTAGAMVEDRERCLSAGMDDYISKPVSIEVMRSCLARWVEPPERQAPSAVLNAMPTTAEQGPPLEPAIDQQRLEDLRDLGSATNSNFLALLADMFATDGAAGLGAMREAVAVPASADLRAAAHKLKGAATNIGANRVAALCGELEVAARDRDMVKTAVTLLDELDTELARANDSLAHSVAADVHVVPSGAAG